jgi:hypothetical protein
MHKANREGWPGPGRRQEDLIANSWS